MGKIKYLYGEEEQGNEKNEQKSSNIKRSRKSMPCHPIQLILGETGVCNNRGCQDGSMVKSMIALADDLSSVLTSGSSHPTPLTPALTDLMPLAFMDTRTRVYVPTHRHIYHIIKK